MRYTNFRAFLFQNYVKSRLWIFTCESSVRYTNESALSNITFYYCHLQDPEYDIKYIIHKLTCGVQFHDTQLKKIAIDIIKRFCNGIPKFILKGNTSKQVRWITPTQIWLLLHIQNRENWLFHSGYSVYIIKAIIN